MHEIADGATDGLRGRLRAALPHGRTVPDARWRARHRGMLALLWAHAGGLPLVALLYGRPVWQALAAGGAVSLFGLAALARPGGRRAQSIVVALGLLTCSAVLVHVTGGLIEAHFHFFVMVALLSLYEDWVLFPLAVAYVLLHDGIAAFVDRESVFNHPGPAWKWAAVHSAFVGALGVACLINWRAGERRRRDALLAHETARAAERLQRSLVDALDEGVMLVDAGGRIAAANPSAHRILGVPAEIIAGVNESDPRWTVLHPDGAAMAEHERPTRITAVTGRPLSGVEIGLRRPDGGVTWLLTSTRPLPTPDGNGPFPVVVSFADMTERREAVAALERSNAELAQFAYVASHDLSEPLRMVSSYLQLLRRRYGRRLDADAHEFIEYAVDGANRMRSLIEDLLAYSRAGRGGEPEPIDSGVVVADVLCALAAAIADARAELRVGRLPVVVGDGGQLGQLFQNLVANALKFRRGARARIWVSAEEAAGGTWRFTVADAGIGIDPRHHDRIFEMFQRLHDHETYGGTGIGLAICRKIVELHGGRIWVEDREGGGTAFCFTLPAAAPDPTAAAREPESTAAPA